MKKKKLAKYCYEKIKHYFTKKKKKIKHYYFELVLKKICILYNVR